MLRLDPKTWGEALSGLFPRRKHVGLDLLAIAGLAGLFFGLLMLEQQWTAPLRPVTEINLSPSALPKYAFYSLARGLLAYILSLIFTLVYGYWAAKDLRAEKLLLPLLDILQSIPVLGFMPGLVLGLVALFPASNIGLELAAVLMIFTGQAWNMTFSFYHSLKSVPRDLAEVSDVYRFNPWRRLRKVELPYAAIGLVWNSMMSMAGGWFFLMVSESFVLGDRDFRLPGLGSYMTEAVAKNNTTSMLWAILTMTLMIVTLNQILWRPLAVWSKKFRIEEGGDTDTDRSMVLDFLNQSRMVQDFVSFFSRWFTRFTASLESTPSKEPVSDSTRTSWGATLLLLIVSGLLMAGLFRLVLLLRTVDLGDWLNIGEAGFFSLLRVLTAITLGTLWALPAGLAIGLNPRLSRIFQPIVQVAASFPAPMLFPAAVVILQFFGITLNWGSIVLMLLGTQWYILFNVIAGASSVPADLREASQSYRLPLWKRCTALYFPAVFPYLVTGWVTAAGGAWNASIVSEYVTHKGQVLTAFGLGSMVSQSAERADFGHLAASLVAMSCIVILFNRLVWRRCYLLAEQRFSLTK
jgi:NitT/TauT family transport system permease protein